MGSERMVRMKRIRKILVLVAMLLWGCGKAVPRPVSHIATGVDIFCQEQDVQISRHYTNSPKMEYVLMYLRLLEPLGKPETDPDTLEAAVFEITVTMADGSRQVYRQKAHRYLSSNGGPWKTIDPEQAAGLYRLIAKVPSDSL